MNMFSRIMHFSFDYFVLYAMDFVLNRESITWSFWWCSLIVFFVCVCFWIHSNEWIKTVNDEEKQIYAISVGQVSWIRDYKVEKISIKSEFNGIMNEIVHEFNDITNQVELANYVCNACLVFMFVWNNFAVNRNRK